MRDDTANWEKGYRASDTLTAEGLLIRPIEGLTQTILSSMDLKTITQSRPVEWPDIAEGAAYTLTLRRDRIMQVGPSNYVDGWDEGTQTAITNVSDAYSVFEITGSNAAALLKRGGVIDLDTPSRSIARNMFGQNVFLYRHTNADTFRLHIARPLSNFMWLSLASALAAMR